MTTTHDENATTWRDLTDRLTAEQIGRFTRQETAALNSIASGRNVYESPEDIAQCFLAEARWEAEQNLTDSTFDVPAPAGAEIEHWEDDGTGLWTRRVHGESRTIDGYDATVYLDGVQHQDGSVAWSLYIHVDDRGHKLTAEQVRQFAARLVEAADELDALDNGL